jgi:hypothetical protein
MAKDDGELEPAFIILIRVRAAKVVHVARKQG